MCLLALAGWAQMVYGQADGAATLDRWLAEADRLRLDPPRAIHRDLYGLPSARQLMARVLLEPGAMSHLTRALMDPGRSMQQRSYAAYLLIQAPGFRSPPTYPEANQLLALHAQEKHPFLKLMLCAALRHTGLLTDMTLYSEREHEIKTHSWTQAGLDLINPTFPVDAELAREVLRVLPQRPRDSENPLGPTHYAPGRFSHFFDSLNTTPDAVRVLIEEFPGSSAERRTFLLWGLCHYTLRGYGKPSPDAQARIADLARRVLLEETDTDLDPKPAVLIFSEEPTIEGARTLVAAARKAKHPLWLEYLRGYIKIAVEEGKWPRDVALDGVFPDGAPSAPEAPRTVPRLRRKPASLVRDPLPVLREVDPEERLRSLRGKEKR